MEDNKLITPDQINLDGPAKQDDGLEVITFGDSSVPTVSTQPDFQPLVPNTPEAQAKAISDFWDMEDVETFDEFETLTPGIYAGKFTELNVKDYKNGGRGFELVFKLDKNGQQDWTYLTFEHTNRNAINMGKRDVKAILVAFGKYGQFTGMNDVLEALRSLVGLTANMTVTWTPKDKKLTPAYPANTNPDNHYINKKFAPPLA